MAVKRGSLSPLKLFGMLRSVSERRMSGELLFEHKQAQVRAQIISGNAFEIESSLTRPHLLGLLVNSGLISSTERVELEAQLKPEESLKEHLIAHGFVAQERLRNISQSLLRPSFLGIFTWPELEYSFDERPLVANPKLTPIDLSELLIEGIARALPPPTLKGFLTSFADHQLTPGARLSALGGFYDQVFPQPNLRAALGHRFWVREACRQAPDRERCFRELCALIVSGIAQPLGGAPGAPPP
ncbi:DUF4388 domain-containing protein, partial [Myxococcota bacterium]|nr:DUF4388 domain-containing protein [Myxococcota bacterium]MBU1897190.1 DUF4388 domain-containing protein [Myxococcota bacterium]